MNNNELMYKNYELVYDYPCDYYVIINMPNSNDHLYEKEKTIVFQMEPYVHDMSKPWGIKTWGEWENPLGFYHVRKHSLYLNPAQWFFIPSSTMYYPKLNRMIAILSKKNYDIGHINRIRFIHYLELNNVDIIDVYGYENYHNLKSYKGKLPDDSKKIIETYKYMFSVENNNEYNYATEKIWEAILSYTLCFYDGCPNLDDYLDPMSYVKIDLASQFNNILHTMIHCIKNDEWSNRIEYIKQDRDKVLKQYNLFECIYKTINKML